MAETETAIQSKVNAVFSSFKGTENELLPLLQRVQEELGYLPQEAMLEVARFIHVPESRVYSAVSFYSQFRLKPAGRRHITVCRGTACHVRGAEKIQETLERELGIKEGETTADLEFSLEAVACVGCCALAPCIVINGEKVLGRLTPQKVQRAVQKVKKEEGRQDAQKDHPCEPGDVL